jgi:mRNA interferase MazF
MMKTLFMTTFKKWDLVLVSFPFTDLKTTKKRPALIIDSGKNDVHHYYLILFITSKIPATFESGDYQITRWQQAGLPKPSLVRYKIATVDASIVIKRLGSLQETDAAAINTMLCSAFCG